MRGFWETSDAEGVNRRNGATSTEKNPRWKECVSWSPRQMWVKADVGRNMWMSEAAGPACGGSGQGSRAPSGLPATAAPPQRKSIFSVFLWLSVLNPISFFYLHIPQSGFELFISEEHKKENSCFEKRQRATTEASSRLKALKSNCLYWFTWSQIPRRPTGRALFYWEPHERDESVTSGHEWPWAWGFASLAILFFFLFEQTLPYHSVTWRTRRVFALHGAITNTNKSWLWVSSTALW